MALGSRIPFQGDSICRIYSMTKPITGVATMTLVERGVLALDQPLDETIPEWRRLRVAVDASHSLDSRPATKAITVRHLLTHTSGLGDWTPSAGAGPLPVAYRARGVTPGNRGTRLGRPGYGPQARTLVEMVERVAELPLATEPGSSYQYSSVGYAALGLVIERISGKAFDVYCRERIFAPLQMASTGFQVEPSQVARLTTNYDLTPAGLNPTDSPESSAWLVRPTLLDGGGGVVSTARDFARFSDMLVNDGSLDGAEVLQPETARLARSNLIPPDVTHDGGYGAGMRVALAQRGGRFRAAGTVSHAGAAGTLWIADPVHHATMVFMTQYMAFPDPLQAESELCAAIEADLA
jgi:CubicO group peptidase (beta-lactamase class C family)